MKQIDVRDMMPRGKKNNKKTLPSFVPTRIIGTPGA